MAKLTPEEKERRKKERQKQKYEQEHKIINGVDHKFCSHHHELFPNEEPWFPATTQYFYKNDKNSTDGLSNRCVKCEKKKAVKWKKNNPEKLKIANKKQNDKPEHKLLHREVERKRRERGILLEYQQNNPDKMKAYTEKRKHKKHNINDEEWNNCLKYFNHRCAYCGLPIEEHYNMYSGELRWENLNKEHAIHNGANDLSNCIPSCKRCNDMKWEYNYDVWYSPNNPLCDQYSEERYNKIVKWLTEDYKKYIIPLEEKNKKKYARKPKSA